MRAIHLRGVRAFASLLAVCAALAAPATAQDSVAVSAPVNAPDADAAAQGDGCPVPGYCERVTLQLRRYFAPPRGTEGVSGEVCFRIQRDGSVTDIQTQRLRGGGAAFRLALMEAAEAAGSSRAFGPLPDTFDPRRWRWCVELTHR